MSDEDLKMFNRALEAALVKDNDRQRAEIERLRAALKPFADAYWLMLSNEPDDTLTGTDDITAGDVRRARAALGGLDVENATQGKKD